MIAIEHFDILTEKGDLGMKGDTTGNYQIAKLLTLRRIPLEAKL